MKISRHSAILLAALVASPLVSCSKKNKQDAEAKAVHDAAVMALKMNPAIEIVKTDDAKGEITYRNKQSGEQVTMSFNDLAQGKFNMKVKDAQGRESSVTGGGDGNVTVNGPDGKMLTESDNADEQGTETLSLITPAAGLYTITVRAADDKAAAARYQIRLVALRTPTEADRQRVNAEAARTAAQQLSEQKEEAPRRQAAAKFEESIQLWRALDDKAEAATTLDTLSLLYVNINDRAKAIETMNQSLSLWRALPDRRKEEAETLRSLAITHNNFGDRAQALEHYQQAIAIYRTLQDRPHELEALLATGVIHLAAGDARRGLETSTQALALARALKDQRREASAMNNLGDAQRRLGEKRKALGTLQQAVALFRATKNTTGEATALNQLGTLYSDLGEMQKALDAFSLALPLRRDPPSRAITLNSLGRVYDLLGAPQEALRQYEQTLPIARAARAKNTEAQTLNFMGLAYWADGDFNRAIDAFNQALPIAREAQNATSEAAAYNNLGLVYLAQKEPQKALDALNQAVPLARRIGNRQYEAYALNNSGFAYEALGQRAKALEAHNAALELARSVGDRPREAKIRFGLARLARDGGQLKAARKQIEETIKIVETVRGKLNDPARRAEYRAATQQYYDLYIDVLMQLHKRAPAGRLNAEALHVSERARARSLLELLAEAGADIRAGAAPELLDRERTLQEQFNDKAAEQLSLVTGKATEAQQAALKQELEQLSGGLSTVQSEIRASSPRYAALTQPQPLTADAIRRQLLAPDTVLLEYALGEERSYVWALTATALRSYALPKRAVIEAAARRFYAALTARNQYVANESAEQRAARIAAAETEWHDAGTALSKLVLSPVAAQLGTRRLLIVADGALQYVPFAALPLQAAPLVVKHEIVVLPSASTLAVLRAEKGERKAAAKQLAVLADPVFEAQDERVQTLNVKLEKKDEKPAETSDGARGLLLKKVAMETGVVADAKLSIPRLPYTRQEAEAILALVPEAQRQASFDFNASRAALADETLGQARVVHVATHGFLNSLNPELSGLVLSLVNEQGAAQNGYLLAPELYNLKLDATELVVLSACQTGLGKEVRGEGLIGLTRGLMYAGAPRVVVSLWSVSDRATAELMKVFYQGMFEHKLRPAAALRAAQVALAKDKRWQAPYYWAAFTLQGEWR